MKNIFKQIGSFVLFSAQKHILYPQEIFYRISNGRRVVERRIVIFIMKSNNVFFGFLSKPRYHIITLRIMNIENEDEVR